MNEPLSRRSFLYGAGALCAAGALGPLPGRTARAESPDNRRPAWPVGTRDAMLRHLGKPDCWSALKSVGAEGLEAVITEELALPGLFHPEVKYTASDAAGLERLRADLGAAGARIHAFCMFNRFEERPEAEVEWCGRVARVARSLGVPAVRIDVVPRKMPKPEFLKLAVEALRKVMAAVGPAGVRLAIENHGAVTNDPEFLAALFEGVGSDQLGLTLDTGNFYWYGHPLSKLYDIFEQFAPRAFHTHFKGINYPEADRERQRPMGWKYHEHQCPIYRADVDFARVTALLDKAGYQGALCVENEALGPLGPEEAVKTLTREIELLKGLRAKLGRAP